MSSNNNKVTSLVDDHLGKDGHTHLCMLMVTHSCNLNCVYCYEKHKSIAEMSFEVAQNAIREEVDFVRNSNGRFTRFRVDFMGGEPLLNFKLIKRVVEWMQQGDFDIPYSFFASTNGTILTDEMKNWFQAHRDVICLGLSYDGDEEMQALNRDVRPVDVDFFRDTWPEQAVRMTISRQTLKDLYRGVWKIIEGGRCPDISLAQGETWRRKDAIDLENQLVKLTDDYIEGRLKNVLNAFTYRLADILDGEHVVSRCGAARNMITYDIDGKKYGCHMFTPIIAGQKNALELENLKEILNSAIPDKRCETCVLKGFCSSCLGFNYHKRGDIAKRDEAFCLMNLVSAKCACYFQIRALTGKENLSQEDAERAKVALKVWPILEQYDCRNAVAPFVAISKERSE